MIDVSDIDGGRPSVYATSPTPMDIVNNDTLMRSVLREDQSPPAQTMLADGAAVIEGAASLVIFLPGRILGGLAQAAAGQ